MTIEQQLQYNTKGYYDNPFFEYVKHKAPKVYKYQTKDLDEFVSIITKGLWDLGRDLEMDDATILHNIRCFGYNSLKYWINKFNLKSKPVEEDPWN